MRLYDPQTQIASFFVTQGEKAQERETQVSINRIRSLQASNFKGHLS